MNQYVLSRCLKQSVLLIGLGKLCMHMCPSQLLNVLTTSKHQKGKTNLNFTEARDSQLQWHQLGHMQVYTSLQTHNHDSTQPLSFLQAGCPSCRPTNSVKALKALFLLMFQINVQQWQLTSRLIDDGNAHELGLLTLFRRRVVVVEHVEHRLRVLLLLRLRDVGVL